MKLCGDSMPKQYKRILNKDNKMREELFKKADEAEKNHNPQKANKLRTKANNLLAYRNPNSIAYYQIQAIRGYIHKCMDPSVSTEKITYRQVCEFVKNFNGYSKKYHHTNIYLVNDSVTNSMRKLPDCLTLVNANQQNPGGGETRGKTAQEEFICYVLATKQLFDALIPVYGNKPIGEKRIGYKGIGLGNCVGAFNVPVLFDESHDYAVLPAEKQKKIDLLFNAATNLTLLNSEELIQYKNEIKDFDKFNLFMIFHFAAIHNYRRINIGAHGCGVFKHDPNWIFKCIKELLEGPFNGVFEDVVFTLIGNPEKTKNIISCMNTFGITDFATIDDDGNIVGKPVILHESDEAKSYVPVMTPNIESFLNHLDDAYDKNLKAELGCL